MIITIDGPSGTGKGTIAKLLAEKLSYSYFDTGAMYRAVTWFFLQKRVDIRKENEIKKALNDFAFQIEESLDGVKKYLVADTDVTKEIRSIDVTSFVSEVSALSVIREKLVPIQRDFAKDKNVIFEGRDMGSVVFSRADFKIFLTASSKIRAKRRYLDLIEKFPDKEFDKKNIQEEIEKRDQFDSKRKISPLKCTKDMFYIDTSEMTPHQIIELIMKRLNKKKRHWKKMPFLYRSIIFFVKIFFRIFYRLKVYGLSHFSKGAAIIAANHTSFYDPPIVGVSSPEEIHFLARDSLFRFPLFGSLIRALNSHPVSNRAEDAKVLREICTLLQKGNKILLFPEGARSYKEKVGELKPGVAFLSYRTKCSIIPVYISGAYHVWSKKRRFPKMFGKITCIFGSPITWEDIKDKKRDEIMKEITDRTGRSLNALKAWYEDGAKGNPP